jgi:hypothetical protein
LIEAIVDIFRFAETRKFATIQVTNGSPFHGTIFVFPLNCRIGRSAMKKRTRRMGRGVGFLSSRGVQRLAGKIAVSIKSGRCYSIRPRKQTCV